MNDARKKAEGKRSREEKDKVMEMLFTAFEKHQYYYSKDLERITKQPSVSGIERKPLTHMITQLPFIDNFLISPPSP